MTTTRTPKKKEEKTSNWAIGTGGGIRSATRPSVAGLTSPHLGLTMRKEPRGVKRCMGLRAGLWYEVFVIKSALGCGTQESDAVTLRGNGARLKKEKMDGHQVRPDG